MPPASLARSVLKPCAPNYDAPPWQPPRSGGRRSEKNEKGLTPTFMCTQALSLFPTFKKKEKKKKKKRKKKRKREKSEREEKVRKA